MTLAAIAASSLCARDGVCYTHAYWVHLVGYVQVRMIYT
jgi:hypothetical protein